MWILFSLVQDLKSRRFNAGFFFFRLPDFLTLHSHSSIKNYFKWIKSPHLRVSWQ